jgi:RNA recognition motif-containing protein
MGTRLFLGNLPWATVDADLESLLRSCGVDFNSVKVVTDRESGRSRGYAFVELAEGCDPNRAIMFLEGAVVGSRDLHVELATSEGPRSGRSGDQRGGPDRRGSGRSRQGRDHGRGQGRRRDRGEDYGWGG